MVSGGAPHTRATLQQGLPLRAERGAAGQFWPFTMSNSKASTFAETTRFDVETCMHVTVTRAALGDARQLARRPVDGRRSVDRRLAYARSRGSAAHERYWRKP